MYCGIAEGTRISDRPDKQCDLVVRADLFSRSRITDLDDDAALLDGRSYWILYTILAESGVSFEWRACRDSHCFWY